MEKNLYEIRNQTDDTAELYLYGIIGDYWDELDAKDIVDDLRLIEAKTIVVHIYSPGGSVFAGLAIYNALKAHPADILVKIDSVAASIASVIAMSGTVEMPENAFLMIHNPFAGVLGDAADMQKMAALLEKVKSSLVGVYNAKTGLKVQEISDMMDAETWMLAAEAVKLGFADTVIGAADPKNMSVFNMLTNYKNVPAALKAYAGKNQTAAPPATNKGETAMPPKVEKTPTPVLITTDLLRAEHPDIIKALIEEGQKLGAAGELERIKAVQAQTMPGHEALIASLMFDGETTGEQAAVKILQAEKTIRIDAKKKLDDDGVPPVNHSTPPDGKDDPTDTKVLPFDQRTKAAWDKDADLRAEFGEDFTSYLAYEQAREAGQVKSLKNRNKD